MDGSKQQPAMGMMGFMGAHGLALKQLVGQQLALEGDRDTWSDQLGSVILEEMCGGRITPRMTLATLSLAQHSSGSFPGTASLSTLFSVVKAFPKEVDALAACATPLPAGNPVDLYGDTIMKAWRLEDRGESFEALLTSIRIALVALGSGTVAQTPASRSPAAPIATPAAASPEGAVPAQEKAPAASDTASIAKPVMALVDGGEAYRKLFGQWQKPAASKEKAAERMAFLDAKVRQGVYTESEASSLKELINSQAFD